MTPQELKNSILQRAIEGKLVEQRAEEGSGEDIVKKLLAEKQKLVENGKVYKKKPTDPFFEGNYPFEIPEEWTWVQLSDVSIIQEGAGIRKFQYKNDGVQLLCVTNILENNIDLDKKQIFISKEEYIKKYQHLTPIKDDIITACSGGSWGKVAIYDLDETVMLNTSTLRMRFFGDLSINKFLYYITQSAFFKDQLKKQMVGIQPNFGYAHYSRIEFPLPPLNEQKRIVEKIEELMPLVEAYEESWKRLEELNKKFPEDMKKSLLQEAIKGKLVEQRPEERTGEELYETIQAEKKKLIKEEKIKKQKALPEITEDEMPFEIPESWKWVRLGEIGEWGAGSTPSRSNPKFYGGKIPWLKTGDLNDSYITDVPEHITDLALNSTSLKLNSVNSVLIAMYGATIGKLGILKKPMTTNQACCACQPINGIYNLYLFYFLMASRRRLTKMAEGGAQPNISRTKIISVTMPLPPLNEQKRIVERLEELLPLCDQLMTKAE